jgi:D-aminoacyl-tRNA deacylase
MRAVIQRVTDAHLTIDNHSSANISEGMVILLGIEESDGAEDISWLSGKICRLRIFRDNEGIMNLSLNEVNGEV